MLPGVTTHADRCCIRTSFIRKACFFLLHFQNWVLFIYSSQTWHSVWWSNSDCFTQPDTTFLFTLPVLHSNLSPGTIQTKNNSVVTYQSRFCSHLSLLQNVVRCWLISFFQDCFKCEQSKARLNSDRCHFKKVDLNRQSDMGRQIGTDHQDL